DVHRCRARDGPGDRGRCRGCMMRRIPPVFLVVLVIMWLLVNSTVSLGHIVLGTIVSALLLLAAAPLRPLQPTIRRGYRLFTLMAVVFVDIVRSNIGVARVILGLVGERDVRAGSVHIPLDMTDPHGLAGLSMIKIGRASCRERGEVQ